MNRTNYPQLGRITAPENLEQAWKRVKAGKAAGGSDGVGVGHFGARADRELEELREELLTGTYVPRPLLQISIPKPHKPGEHRPLGLPSVRDKVAQEAVRRVIEPLLNAQFVDESYGYRPGKGPQKAVKQVSNILAHSHPSWVTALDIDEFFPSLDHDILLDRLRGLEIEEPVCRLLLLWLKMGVVNKAGRWLDVYSGVSQGGVVSPLLANLYLHPLDLHLKENKGEFIRYADDLRLFHGSRREAEALKTEVGRFLLHNLKLKLNPSPEAVAPVDKGFVFLGIHFNGERRLIDPAKRQSMGQKLQRLLSCAKPEDLSSAVRQVNETVAGWQRYYGALVAPGEMKGLAQDLQGVLSLCLAEIFRRHPRLGDAEVLSTLEILEIPGACTSGERRAFLEQTLEQARRAAQKRLEEKQTQEKVAGAVRRAKRHQVRQMLHVTHLVINTPGLFLGKRGQRLMVRQDRRILYEVPLHTLESITFLSQGNAISADLITLCARQGIPLSWISAQGEMEALVYGPGSVLTVLQLRQLEAARDPFQTFPLALALVLGKIKNQIHLIKYFGKYEKRRNGSFVESYQRFLELGERLKAEAKEIQVSDDWPHLRGHLFSIEGRLAAHYWDLVKLLLQAGVDFPGRRRQGAVDLVNSLLNYGYAVLRSRVLQALHRTGLNPQVGFLHAPRQGEPALAFDLMEVFRPHVVDRVVMAELRRRPEVFRQDPDGRLTQDSRGHLVGQLQARLAAVEPFRGRELTLEEIIQAQAGALRQHLEGKARFRPYLGKW